MHPFEAPQIHFFHPDVLTCFCTLSKKSLPECSKICFEILELLINVNMDFFEYTQISCIIDYIFEKNKIKFLVFNFLYVSQAVLVSVNQLYPDIMLTMVLSIVLAVIILSIEFIQFI